MRFARQNIESCAGLATALARRSKQGRSFLRHTLNVLPTASDLLNSNTLTAALGGWTWARWRWWRRRVLGSAMNQDEVMLCVFETRVGTAVVVAELARTEPEVASWLPPLAPGHGRAPPSLGPEQGAVGSAAAPAGAVRRGRTSSPRSLPALTMPQRKNG
jgi:hypothetical protein